MARPTTRIVSADELASLFAEHQIWEQIRDGRLSQEEIPNKRVESWAFPDGRSVMLRHRNQAGDHIATTHCFEMPDGSRPHWDESDLHLTGIVYVKAHRIRP